jgi:hypothetical protein
MFCEFCLSALQEDETSALPRNEILGSTQRHIQEKRNHFCLFPCLTSIYLLILSVEGYFCIR